MKAMDCRSGPTTPRRSRWGPADDAVDAQRAQCTGSPLVALEEELSMTARVAAECNRKRGVDYIFKIDEAKREKKKDTRGTTRSCDAITAVNLPFSETSATDAECEGRVWTRSAAEEDERRCRVRARIASDREA